MTNMCHTFAISCFFMATNNSFSASTWLKVSLPCFRSVQTLSAALVCRTTFNCDSISAFKRFFSWLISTLLARSSNWIKPILSVLQKDLISNYLPFIDFQTFISDVFYDCFKKHIRISTPWTYPITFGHILALSLWRGALGIQICLRIIQRNHAPRSQRPF